MFVCLIFDTSICLMTLNNVGKLCTKKKDKKVKSLFLAL